MHLFSSFYTWYLKFAMMSQCNAHFPVVWPQRVSILFQVRGPSGTLIFLL